MGSGSKVRRILDLGVTFLTSVLHSVSGLHVPAALFLEKGPIYPAKWEVVGPQIWSGLSEKRKSLTSAHHLPKSLPRPRYPASC